MSEIKTSTILRYAGGIVEPAPDALAVEEPLEIRVEYGPEGQRQMRNLSVTMRTPGADEDLVAGFLFTEGIVKNATDIQSIESLDPCDGNIVLARLDPDLNFDLSKLERHFYTTSSCGVCGKSSINAVKMAVPARPSEAAPPAIDPEIIYSLPDKLRQAQSTFDATGGLHASAFFTHQGELLALREDVGRHNALDKLIGHYLCTRGQPMNDGLLLLSGRASFELLQKAAMAGIRVVCAVGAPSSLAVETAQAFGITLIGFLRQNRFNLYTNNHATL